MKKQNKTSIKHDQHFLINQSYAIEIINLLNLEEDDIIIEIGPGNGALSNHLKNNKHFLVEIDENLSQILKERNYNVINENFLKINNTFLEENHINKLISNLPYSISEPFVFKILKMYEEKKDKNFKGVLMVGESFYYIIKGNFSMYADFFQAFFQIKDEILVKPENFNPPPSVDSYVFCFENKKEITDDMKISMYLYDCFKKKLKITSIVRNYFWNELNLTKRESKEKSNIFLDKKKEEFKNKQLDNLNVFEYFEIKDFLFKNKD
ncbi:MAG: rRNA adenine N-6-methyltransferase family protein [Candidatus Nanoarchaeia archaeon]|nr:rRNA adenine N-6-methyltransferase family protein [Candidatus Nanoarchaeia archaeon]